MHFIILHRGNSFVLKSKKWNQGVDKNFQLCFGSLSWELCLDLDWLVVRVKEIFPGLA